MHSKLEKMKGIVTVLNTPFDAQYNVDVDSLKKNIEYAIKSGVKGILVPAKAAEVDKLTFEEREIMVKTAIETINGRIPIIAGTQSKSEEDAVQFAKKAIDMDVDGILISTSYQSKAQMERFVGKFNQLNAHFMILQDWAFDHYGIPISVLLSLFSSYEQLQGVKIEVVPAGIKYSEILQETKDKIHVSGGWAVTQMIEALDRGVHALMPTGMHELYVKIDSLYKTNKKEAAEQLFRKILPILAFSNQHLDISIHFFKHLLYEEGIHKTPYVRKPILEIDEIYKTHIKKLIQYYFEIKKETIITEKS